MQKAPGARGTRGIVASGRAERTIPRVIDPGERAELEASRDLYGVISEQGSGRRLEIAGGVCGTIDALPNVLMANRVLGLGVERRPETQELDEIDAFFRAAGTRYYVCVSPQAHGLEELLEDRGFERGYAWAVFRRGVEPYEAATELRVEEVAPEQAADFGAVVSSASEFPPELAETVTAVVGRAGWHCWVSYDGDRPAGAAAMFVHDRAAWFGFAGTLPEHRRKGSQGSLFAARVQRARELGVEVLGTETGENLEGRPSNSYRNIVRVGFEERYVRPNYASPA